MKTLALSTIPSIEQPRLKTNNKSFDSFLGGGFVNGQAIFLAGEPGVGKSTLLLQIATMLTDQAQPVLYISGEESLEQLKLRADRLGTVRDSIYCTETTDLADIYNAIDRYNPKFIIIDSLQMITSKEVKGTSGSTKQMEACLLSLNAHAKKTNRIVIVIGHSTKSGLIAGQLKLQHMVDTVLFATKDGQNIRYMHAKKNRFGNVDEVFTMHMQATGFKEFSQQIVKGTQVAPIVPYLHHIYGDEARFTRQAIEKEIHSGFVRLLYHSVFRFLEQALFGQVIGQDYEIVYKLKATAIDKSVKV